MIDDIRRCDACVAELPHGTPRPIVSFTRRARIVIIGQAPGARVHESGVPWDDESGKRLRDWLGIDRGTFYDPNQVALVPMGFCYPGKGKSGDLPPRPECAPLWMNKVLAHLENRRLTVLIGQYAQRWFLPERGRSTVTDAVRGWRRYLPDRLVLPHPSPRNNRWLLRNPWFEADVLPELRRRVESVLQPPGEALHGCAQ